MAVIFTMLEAKSVYPNKTFTFGMRFFSYVDYLTIS